MADNFAFPHRFISGLPKQAQHEIWRNFETLAQRASSSAGFDAIIDPAQPTNAGSHIYKNITDFTVGEALKLNAFNSLLVRVIGRPGTSIVETSNITLGGNVTFMGPGMQGALGYMQPGGGRPVIDFNGHTVTNAQWASFVGLELTNTGTAIATLFSGSVYFDNCVLNCSNSGSGLQKITTVTGGAYAIYKDCSLYQAASLGSSLVWCQECLWTWPVAGGSIGAAGGSFYWDGGSFDAAGASPVLVFSGAANVFCRGTFNTGFSGSSAGVRTGVSITTTGECFVDIQTLQNPPDLTISATAGDVTCRGFYETVTVQGNTNNRVRNIDVSHSNGTMDITGPCKFSADLGNVSGSPKCIFRGAGITANVQLNRTGSNPWLALVACTDSTIIASLTPTGAGEQAYTVDAASARCVIVLSGSTAAAFSVGSTNAGTNVLVITETSGGVPGPPGTNGTNGLNGLNGPPGSDGDDGAEGFPGSSGQPGATGAAGSSGAAGLAGAPGMQGEDGMPGDEGFPGTTGPAGAAGAAGASGVAGLAGAMGMQGEDGAPGEDGFPGSTPPQGAYALLNAIGGFGVFGDGSDGVVTFDGTTTVLGLVPSANVYTLTRDIYLANGSALTGSAKISAVGFRVFCSGTLTIGALASIHCNGNNAVTTGGGASTPANYYGTGGAGGAGVAGAGAGTAGGAMTTSIGGAGGAGGAAAGGPGIGGGAAGGTATAPSTAQGGVPRNPVPAIIGAAGNGAPTYKGGGGGAGGASVLSSNSGGGGGAGGILLVAALQLTNNGTISANGGAGAAASGAGTGAGGGGGGGGGGVWIIAGPLSSIGTVTATGGVGGALQGAGKTGAAGAAGTVILLTL